MQATEKSVPVPSLQNLESAVCDYLTKQEAGTVDPYSRRLEGDVGHDLAKLGHRIGHRYVHATLKGFEVYDDKQRATIERLTRFAENMPDCLRQSGGLLLYGPPGTGKDHLLAALLKIAIAKHKLTALWYDGGELFDEFYLAIKNDDDSLRDLQIKLRKPHILAISDPQPPQGPLSDSQIRRLRDLIDARYRAGVSTWMTTNLDSREDTVTILTDPVRQRLKEGSAVIDCNWPSYRERKVATW